MSFPLSENDPSVLLVLSGPAGCGKTTLCERLTASDPSIERAITCTTRAPRPGEVDGTDYFFLTEERFEQAVANGEFLEYAGVHGKRYGTLRSEVEKKLGEAVSLILNIDVQGAATLRAAAQSDALLRGRIVSVFVLPPNLEILRERLLHRGTETMSSIEQRLKTAAVEMQEWTNYDYCIRSASKDEDFQRLQSILLAERSKVARLRGTI